MIRIWQVVHGSVDSIWMTPDYDVYDNQREDLDVFANETTEDVEIRLKHESHYDWVAFVLQPVVESTSQKRN